MAGPEAADNASALTHFIPMLTLGIPAGAVFAMMLGALMIQGIPPGPQIITQHPDLFWGLIASMWVGNVMLLVFNLPLIGVWIRLLMTPYRFLYPAILTFSCIGVYTVRNEVFDVLTAAAAGAVGFVLRTFDCSASPLILGLILGPILEDNLRRSLLISGGDPSIFVTRPISLGLLLLAAAMIIVFSLPAIRKAATARKTGAVDGPEVLPNEE